MQKKYEGTLLAHGITLFPAWATAQSEWPAEICAALKGNSEQVAVIKEGVVHVAAAPHSASSPYGGMSKAVSAFWKQDVLTWEAGDVLDNAIEDAYETAPAVAKEAFDQLGEPIPCNEDEYDTFASAAHAWGGAMGFCPHWVSTQLEVYLSHATPAPEDRPRYYVDFEYD